MSTFCRARVYIQPLCSGVWNDISGKGASVAWTGGEVATTEQHTFEGDAPVVEEGKPSKVTVTSKVLYSEGVAEATEMLRAIYESPCGRGICFRWRPLGATAGNKQYTTVSGILVTPTWPQGEAKADETTLVEFDIVCPSIFVDDVV